MYHGVYSGGIFGALTLREGPWGEELHQHPWVKPIGRRERAGVGSSVEFFDRQPCLVSADHGACSKPRVPESRSTGIEPGAAPPHETHPVAAEAGSARSQRPRRSLAPQAASQGQYDPGPARSGSILGSGRPNDDEDDRTRYREDPGSGPHGPALRLVNRSG